MYRIVGAASSAMVSAARGTLPIVVWTKSFTLSSMPHIVPPECTPLNKTWPVRTGNHGRGRAGDRRGAVRGAVSTSGRRGRPLVLGARRLLVALGRVARTACAAASRATGTRNGEHDT